MPLHCMLIEHTINIATSNLYPCHVSAITVLVCDGDFFVANISLLSFSPNIQRFKGLIWDTVL